MHAADRRDEALRLVAAGANDCEISRRLGIPRTTIRDWRRPPFAPKTYTGRCPRCGGRTRRLVIDSPDYAELLGLYLGDGHIARGPRTQRLRLSLDASHPVIVRDAEALLRRVFPDQPVGRLWADKGATVVLWTYSNHLACLLPQHGPGKKHHRKIALEGWQQELVDAAPWAFLRGCIRSDGCVFVNRTGPYEYLSYDFTNYSAGILDLFVATCADLGLRPRRYARRVRLYRREDVARLVEHVGMKG